MPGGYFQDIRQDQKTPKKLEKSGVSSQSVRRAHLRSSATATVTLQTVALHSAVPLPIGNIKSAALAVGIFLPFF